MQFLLESSLNRQIIITIIIIIIIIIIMIKRAKGRPANEQNSELFIGSVIQ